MIRTLLQDKSDKSDQAPPMSLALAQPPPPYVAPPMFSTCLLQRLIPTSPLVLGPTQPGPPHQSSGPLRFQLIKRKHD